MKTKLFFEGEENQFSSFVDAQKNASYIILADANTNGFCVPVVLQLFPCLRSAQRIVIPQGESNKSMQMTTFICAELLKLQANNNTILVCVGGGMVCDIGGFAASIYQRGIETIYIPTTLLGMIDACYGGKTGVNFEGVKNYLGSFHPPKAIFAQPIFLKTLDSRVLQSGIAEGIKHALLSNTTFWHSIQNVAANYFYSLSFIKEALLLKKRYVDEDERDKGIRQSLNLGHSIGHAIESYSFQTATPLLHGEAIMLGLKHELRLSMQLFQMPLEIYDAFCTLFANLFPAFDFSYTLKDILPFLVLDKKNQQEIRMSLLKDIGEPILQMHVSMEELTTSF